MESDYVTDNNKSNINKGHYLMWDLSIYIFIIIVYLIEIYIYLKRYHMLINWNQHKIC